MPLSFLPLVVIAGLVAPARSEPAPPPVEPPPEAASPLDGRAPARSPASRLPPHGAEPLQRAAPDRAAPFETTLPPDGAEPLDGPSPAHRRTPTAPVPPDGVEPLDGRSPTSATPPTFELPLGMPEPKPAQPPDPATVRLVRVDFMLGPVWRIRPTDFAFGTSVEFGRMHGFSAAFHTDMLLVTERRPVRAFDFPIGVGVIARGKLRDKQLYGSVGLTAGILVHRAKFEDQLVHRVDPDFRLPIRLAWTVGGIGASVAVVPGYSVRERLYERRGNVVLNRHSVRIGLMVGLHWDITAGRAKARRYDRRRDGRH